MADDKVQFNREPYTVKYVDLAGEVKTIRRVPPPKLHEALPTDVVELTRKKNDDFDAGDKLEVVSISPRQPNVLQVRNGDGQTTFVDYFDMRLNAKVASPTESDATTSNLPNAWYRDRSQPESRYLIWP